MRRLILSAAVLMLFAPSAEVISAQAKQRVRLARGESGTMLNGAVRGYSYRDYIVGAAAGQTISVELSSSNGFSVLSIFQPNGDNLNGAAQTNKFIGELPSSGNYVIRVGMMRAQARRRGSSSRYTLAISVR